MKGYSPYGDRSESGRGFSILHTFLWPFWNDPSVSLCQKECTGTVASSCLSHAWNGEKIKDRGCWFQLWMPFRILWQALRISAQGHHLRSLRMVRPAHQYFLQSPLGVSNGEQADRHNMRQIKVVPVWKRKIKTEWFNWDCSLKDCECESFLEGNGYRSLGDCKWEEDALKNDSRRSNKVTSKGRWIKYGQHLVDKAWGRLERC